MKSGRGFVKYTRNDIYNTQEMAIPWAMCSSRALRFYDVVPFEYWTSWRRCSSAVRGASKCNVNLALIR